MLKSFGETKSDFSGLWMLLKIVFPLLLNVLWHGSATKTIS